jgi:hypothetical protein
MIVGEFSTPCSVVGRKGRQQPSKDMEDVTVSQVYLIDIYENC